MSDTPRTDAEARRMTIDCDDSCVEIYVKQDGRCVEGDIVIADFAHQLERELNAAKAELAAMKKVIRKIYYETETCADGAPDATAHDKLCNEVSSQLEPYIK